MDIEQLATVEMPGVDTEILNLTMQGLAGADDARTSSKTSSKISPGIAVRHKQLLPSTRQ